MATWNLLNADDPALARTAINAAGGNSVSVKDYDAAGDGVADDTDAFQTAINEMSSDGGGTVCFPTGTYLLTDTITMADNVTLTGAGPGSILTPAYASLDVNRVIDNDWVNGNSNIALQNFTIDRTGAYVTHGVLFNGIDSLLIDGITIFGDPGSGLNSGCIGISSVGPLDEAVAHITSTNVRVVNCDLRDVWNYGVQVGDVDGCVIANNTASNAYREVYGVEPEAASTARNVVISGNTVAGSATVRGSVTGLIVATEGSGGTIHGLTISGNSLRQPSTSASDNPGIAIYGGTAITITGNTCYGLDGAGISIGSGASPTDGVVVQGNSVTNCGLNSGFAGIRLRNGTRCAVTGNYVYGASHAAGVEETLTAGNNLVAWNYLRDTTPVTTVSGSDTLVMGNKGVDGDINVAMGTDNSTVAQQFGINASSGTWARSVAFQTAGVNRWQITCTGSESGSNTGSDLYFSARQDAGTSNGDAVTIKRADRRVILGGGFSVPRVAKTSTSSAAVTDVIVAVTTTAAPRTITLPSAVTVAVGALLIVKDESGGAAANNITVARAAAETIDGATSVTISTNYGAVRLYSNGSNWFTW